uniref:phosphatidylinositol-3,4,5-trisphosphate 5-phosphatase n=1 Tax=Oryzias sinensis TaxID=183150 RepID=A0A8C7ZC86_9TELE
MALAPWYHRDISRVYAEELLARAGRDGSFLVRDSESVPGAYALCLLFQCHVHTYRILPDADGLLAVQTTQGVQVNCFRTLEDLVLGYQHPHKGLVSPLLHPVHRDTDQGDESSGKHITPSYVHTGSREDNTLSLRIFPLFQVLNVLIGITFFLVCSVAGEVIGLLSDYLLRELPLDIENIHKGATTLCHLKRTLGSNKTHSHIDLLHSEIDLTLSSLETLAKVFDHPSCSITFTKAQGPEMEIDSLLCKISALANLLSSLEKRVLKALQEAVTNHNLAVQPSPPSPSNVTHVKNHAEQLPVHSFQVKMLRYGRQTVSVDVSSGVVLFDKKLGSFSIEKVSHARILQIVKLQSTPAKVRLVVDSYHHTPREMTFESARKCDAFCQLLLLMKSRQCQRLEPDVVSVFVGTWNMGGSSPPRSLQSWVTCCGLGHTPDESVALLPHDIYALGTQENPQGEKEWTEHIKATLHSCTQIHYKQVAVQSLWNMRLAVFVKPEHESRISRVNTASVKTGLGNTLGNKGAVGVSFFFGGTSFGFVNCHLTSGSDKVLRRNQNYVDILRLLSLGDKHLSAFDISLQFTHLFWCGDLNYSWALSVWLSPQEEKITFPPTYRYERGSRGCYLWQKYKTSGVRVNVPSWCDRVLWKSYPETHVVCTAYGCTDDIFTSDHSPVFATFQVGVTSLFNSKRDSSLERAWIELEGIEAIVKTASKAKFVIEFYSSCLEDICCSSENDSQSCYVPGFLKLGWSFKQLPKLLPLTSDMEHLQDQHLLLSVKSCDGFESYGECCVALYSLTGASEKFETFLSHRGEEMGSIRGRIRVHVPKDRRATRRKIYGSLPPVSQSYIASSVFTSSSFTNPAYYLFEGVSVPRRAEEALSSRKDPQVIWSGSEALQLPKVSERQGFDRRLHRRSDFTEIEIPAVLPQCSLTSDFPASQTSSSYQLFPIPPDCTKPESSSSTYMNHSAIIRQKNRLDQHQLHPTQNNVIQAIKSPPALPYTPTHLQKCHFSSAWPATAQQPHGPSGPTGDNSLTALQIAKSLSEVSFFPAEQRSPSFPSHRGNYRNGPFKHGDQGYSWEKEVSVLRGAPETVRELLCSLGLQTYTYGLSVNGWDDLDYFSGITEEDLCAAGVTNPSHRRRILENLPWNWN